MNRHTAIVTSRRYFKERGKKGSERKRKEGKQLTLIPKGVIDDADGGLPVDGEAERDAGLGEAVDEVSGPVDGVDDEGGRGRDAGLAHHVGLLADEGEGRVGLAQALRHMRFYRLVGFCHYVRGCMRGWGVSYLRAAIDYIVWVVWFL